MFIKTQLTTVCITLFIFMLSTPSYSTPTINGLTGTLEDGKSITISGDGFGDNGPNVEVFENFEGGLTGEIIDLDATVGSWDGHESQYYPPTYSDRARSGEYSGKLSSDATGTHAVKAGFHKNFNPVQEYYLSYGVQVPPGTYFPQSASSAPIGDFPNESVWKFAWIRDYINDPDSSPGDDDKCLPSHINYGRMTTAGNGLKSLVTIHTPADTWWQWGSWNRFAFWAKADGDNPATENGQEWVQAIGEDVVQIQRAETELPLFKGGIAPYQWTRLHINGWIRPTELAKPVALLYDDIYLATGPNAAARIEIGNSANYESATKLAIFTPESWSNDSVVATVQLGPFGNNDQVYIFIIDSENIPSAGFGPFVVNGVTSAPQPPVHLQIIE